MDETPVRAGRKPGRPGKMKTGHYWPVLGERGEVVFPFARSRQHRHVAGILGDHAGTLVSDGYGACEAHVAIREKMVKQQGCRAHVRRKFEEQLASHPQLAAEALALIAPIHAIEDEIAGKPPGVRLEARRSRTRPVVDAFRVWCRERQEDPALTPKHPIARAVGYAATRQATLEVFLEDPQVPPDSNGVERQLRGIKLGQKNWLFSWTGPGARNVGIINSCTATCRMQGIDPCIWLTDVLIRAGTHPNSRIDELTPRRWAELFADNPMTSDIATTGWRHAAMGRTWRLRRRRTVKPAPSGSADSSVGDSDSDFRPRPGSDANSPCSRRLDQMKKPPWPAPSTLIMVRRRLMNTYHLPEAGFSPGRVCTSAHRPSKDLRMSAASVCSRMPPAGQPARHRPPEAQDHAAARFGLDIPARIVRWWCDLDEAAGLARHRMTEAPPPVPESLAGQRPRFAEARLRHPRGLVIGQDGTPLILASHHRGRTGTVQIRHDNILRSLIDERIILVRSPVAQSENRRRRLPGYPAPACRILPGTGLHQCTEPVEGFAHVRRLRLRPDAAGRPAGRAQAARGAGSCRRPVRARYPGRAWMAVRPR